MIIDASALVAIAFGEPERRAFTDMILSQPTRLASTASLLEAGMVVLGRLGEPGLERLRAVLEQTDVQSAPFTADQLDIALDAFRRFGKGRHPAGLNFGDCFSYALAKATGEPLLFKGDDFSRTDIARAV